MMNQRATGANLRLIIEKHSHVLGAIVLPANLQDACGTARRAILLMAVQVAPRD